MLDFSVLRGRDLVATLNWIGGEKGRAVTAEMPNISQTGWTISKEGSRQNDLVITMSVLQVIAGYGETDKFKQQIDLLKGHSAIDDERLLGRKWGKPSTT
jgi:hypothetical protein